MSDKPSIDVFPGVKSERRAFPRHPIRTQAFVVLGDGRQLEARTLDIGKGGMAIVTGINSPVGSQFGVRLTLPVHPKGNALFEAQVRVANCVLDGVEGGFRLGLEFLTLEPTAKGVLDRALT